MMVYSLLCFFLVKMTIFWKSVYDPKTRQLLAQDMDGWSYEVPKLRHIHAL